MIIVPNPRLSDQGTVYASSLLVGEISQPCYRFFASWSICNLTRKPWELDWQHFFALHPFCFHICRILGKTWGHTQTALLSTSPTTRVPDTQQGTGTHPWLKGIKYEKKHMKKQLFLGFISTNNQWEDTPHINYKKGKCCLPYFLYHNLLFSGINLTQRNMSKLVLVTACIISAVVTAEGETCDFEENSTIPKAGEENGAIIPIILISTWYLR